MQLDKKIEIKKGLTHNSFLTIIYNQFMNVFNRKKDAPGLGRIREEKIISPRGSADPINPITHGKFDPVNTNPKGMDAPDASNDQRWSSMKNGGYYKQ